MTHDKHYTSLSANTIMAKLTNHVQWTKPIRHRLTNTIHLTLKMTSAQVVETSVTNNSSFQNYSHADDHTIRTTDTPGLKPFTMLISDVSHVTFLLNGSNNLLNITVGGIYQVIYTDQYKTTSPRGG